MSRSERRLPKELLDRATLRGSEFAWRIPDIPAVIGAARDAGLVSIGGQLQFRLPEGGTCECYWIQVDTYRSVSKSLPWDERVRQTAEVALTEFTNLALQYDFLEEGRRSFGKWLQEIEANGGDPADSMCFVWSVLESDP